MAWGKSSRGGGGGCLAVLALLVALAALFVAWSAYKRTGGTVEQLTRGTVTVSDLDLQGALDKARQQLQQHEPEVQDQRNLEQVRRDVAEIRARLERTFNNSGADSKEKWRGIDGDLQRLEQQRREGGGKAKATLDEAVEKMKR